MKAWVLHKANDIRYDDIDMPHTSKGHALIKVQNAGICSSDISRIYITGAYKHPIIPGHEFSGVVKDVGHSGDISWIGKRVSAFPLIPCFTCKECLKTNYETCINYSYIGSRQNGAFAEYVSVPVWNLIEIPVTIDSETAALLEPITVALHAVKKMDFANVNTAAIVGSGPIGHLIALWLIYFGINDVVIIKRDSPMCEVDACFEAVGSSNALERCINSTRPNGQVILVGNPNTEFLITQSLYWQILRKQLKIFGTWNSQFRNEWEYATDIMSLNTIQFSDIISHKYKLCFLNTALDMMLKRKENRCKVILSM